MLKKHEAKSFERAIFDGDIQGPNWEVVDEQTGEQVDPGRQDFRHTAVGRRVISLDGDNLAVTVIDYQKPAQS
jgi:hypothetical protein